MVVTVLNAAKEEAAAQILLSHHLAAFADVDIIAGQKHYPAHRAVLAVHSLDFRDAFSAVQPPSAPSAPSAPPTTIHVAPAANSTALHNVPHPLQLPDIQAPAPAKPPDRYRVHIALDDVDDGTLVRGWALVYSYIYGATVHLDTEAVLAALPICRRYRFDELAAVLDAFLCDGAVSHTNCTRVYAAAGLRSSSKHRRRNADAELVRAAAWNVMKSRFAHVRDWGVLPYGGLVRLLKLNDLHLPSEMAVFDAVVEWANANRDSVDDDVVAGLVKLVRFPTMSMTELEICAGSDLVRSFPVCRKYVSRGLAARNDERRGLVRSSVIENSPVYRRRRTDALTFSDRVKAWSRVEATVHTSARYFAGCLWNLIVEIGDEWVGLFLGCQSETDDKEVDVELDFSVFVVKHSAGDLELVKKEVKGACFSKSGQRIGFSRHILRDSVELDRGRFLLRDTLFIGASIRLRSSKSVVIGISDDADDTAEAESTMI